MSRGTESGVYVPKITINCPIARKRYARANYISRFDDRFDRASSYAVVVEPLPRDFEHLSNNLFHGLLIGP